MDYHVRNLLGERLDMKHDETWMRHMMRHCNSLIYSLFSILDSYTPSNTETLSDVAFIFRDLLFMHPLSDGDLINRDGTHIGPCPLWELPARYVKR